ncbi:MAG: S-methyl-5'-thioadenosine phosphorylase [Cohaesibacteraceae bacterium]|nr:S-methyl-5'-thioadenosine phosphorylase [Cohaesibacteraceae bacterium]MBL4875468.1 S-methyl-5'-thioadenosine phosphorylase [Cohaesibacteraceae bacterium]
MTVSETINTVLGIIGGSGLYELPGIEDAEWVKVDSPWGDPSDCVRVGSIDGLKVVFLPRHGRGHVFAPSDINYRANIDVMKRCGVTDLVSVSACGSLNEKYAPGSFVLVDQFVDRTFAREKSFFGKGCVAHVSVAHPVSPHIVDQVEAAAKKTGVEYHRGGLYLAMEGPQFSSLAESRLYRQWGCDVIGMTNMPEAKLAREAEISYATIAMVTDFDSWHPDHGSVDIQDIIRVLGENSSNAQGLISQLAKDFPRQRPLCKIGSDRALEFAIMTAPEKRKQSLLSKLDAVAGRVLDTN